VTPRRGTVRRPAGRPLVVAHRGASWAVAEHTLAAYEAAIDSGADGLECDVRLTRDGHLVCVHDRTINRTSDARGVVSDLALDELDGIDFESWRGELPHSADHLLGDSPYGPYLAGVAPDHVRPGAGVLTLETLLELVRDASQEVRLLIETKHPTRYGGLVEKSLVELLARFGWAGPSGPSVDLRRPADPDGRVLVMSFATTAIRRVRLQAPAVPTVLLLERLLLPTRREAILPPGTAIAGPGLHVLQADPTYVARAHARGHQVFVWTVDEPDEVEFVRALGVDAIITNRPAEVLEQLG
jgi:glycerophosphoryl diester phosphodiesterase